MRFRGDALHGGFVGHGRSVAQCGMQPDWVVPIFDEAEAGHFGFGLGCKAASYQQLAFQGREEALAHGIVAGVANQPSAGPSTGLWPAEPSRQLRPSTAERLPLCNACRMPATCIAPGSISCRNGCVSQPQVLVKRLGRCSPRKGLSRPGVESQRHRLEGIRAVRAQVGALWEILPQQPPWPTADPAEVRVGDLSRIPVVREPQPQTG